MSPNAIVAQAAPFGAQTVLAQQAPASDSVQPDLKAKSEPDRKVKGELTDAQRMMMRVAGRVNTVRWGSALMVTLVVGITMRHLDLSDRVQTRVASLRNPDDVLVTEQGSFLGFVPESPQLPIIQQCR